VIILINYVFIYCTCIYLCVNISYVGGVRMYDAAQWILNSAM